MLAARMRRARWLNEGINMNAKPRMPAPKLEVATVSGATWRLSDSKPDSFTMIVVYRGRHCPLCKTYLGELESKLGEFKSLGVNVIALSMDDAQKAAESKEDWGLQTLTVGYGMTEASAREWNLFLSKAVKEGEPELFSEPGMFLIKADGTLFTASVANTPWARPPIDQMLKAIGFFNDRKPPARGEA